jgi:tRNA modification GTPase
VGKSSLFNALVKRHGCTDARVAHSQTEAIVSPVRGTTRDYLTARLSIDGQQCDLVDTAGVDAVVGSSGIDAAAHVAAIDQRKRADIRAFCIEATDATYAAPGDCDLIVRTKIDLAPRKQCVTNVSRNMPEVVTSSQTTFGLDGLCEAIRLLLAQQTSEGSSTHVVANTAKRCRESVRLARLELEEAVDIVTNAGGSELVAIALRSALTELGKVVGAVYTDDLLDRIFGTFCIGI